MNFIYCWLLLFPLLIHGEFTVNPRRLTINEPVHVTFSYPKNINYSAEQLRGKILSSGKFILLKEIFSEDEKEKKFEWDLEPLVSGEFPLSLYQLDVPNSKPLFVPIFNVVVDPFDKIETPPQLPYMSLTPQIPPSLSEANQALLSQWQHEQPERNRELIQSKKFPWIPLFAILLLLTLAPLFYLFYEKRKNLKDIITPEQKALSEIELLEEGHFENSDDLIVKLSSSLRRYLQEKYNLLAPHQTTEEFLKSSASHPLLNSGQGEKLILFLQASDQVKFATREPSEKEKETAIQFAKNFIASNLPPEPQDDEEVDGPQTKS